MSARLRKLSCVVACLAALCSGCTPIPNVPSANVIIPNETLNISKSASFTAEGVVAAALIYLIVDPLAPNWQIEEKMLDADRYAISMKKKRFTTGGDGEAAQIFYRRAAQLVREQGGARYRVIAYTEGIESTVPIAQRVAQGVVEVVR